MSENKLWNDILRARDELKLKLHLAGMDARDAFEKLDTRIEKLSQEAESKAGKLGDQITDEVRTTLGELEVELKRIREKIDAKQKS